MGYKLVEPRRELLEIYEFKNQNKTQLDSTKDVDLHKPFKLKPKRFWWLKFYLLFFIEGVFGLPLLIYSFIQSRLKKKKSVKGKVVVVTGAARGIGRQLSLKLARLGAHVACADINNQGVEETVKMIRTEGGRAAAFTMNIAKHEQIKKFRDDVEQVFGPVDILINNAALLMALRFSEWEEKEIRAFYDVNLLSHLWMLKTFVPSMLERKCGHVVTLSSASAILAGPFLSIYGSSKAAVTTLVDNLREEMESLNQNFIKFTTIHPIFVNTSLEVTEFCDLGVPIMEVDDAADSMIESILLEEENVSLPKSVWTFALVDKLLPKLFHDLAIKIIKPTVCLPDIKIKEVLPYKRIINATINNK